jgi:hypothetical protein
VDAHFYALSFYALFEEINEVDEVEKACQCRKINNGIS